jgi:hypothetical protein
VLRPASSVNWHNTSNGLLKRTTFVSEKGIFGLDGLGTREKSTALLGTPARVFRLKKREDFVFITK